MPVRYRTATALKPTSEALADVDPNNVITIRATHFEALALRAETPFTNHAATG
jgi:hypothetical protein